MALTWCLRAPLACLAVLVLLLGAWPIPLHAQQVLAPVASYTITVRLDDASKQLVGEESIVYRNPSQDTLSEVYFRLYLNAFRAADTLWMRERGADSGYDPAYPGWTRLDRLELADGVDLLAAASLDDSGTVLRVPLPRPLAPGEELRLRVAWTAQLPRSFARTGFGGDFVFAGQWYPKLAVYDPRHGGWDDEPWHANAEFFADFGHYDLDVTVPPGRVVASSGVPLEERDNGDGTRTLRARAENVTDVARSRGSGLVSAERQVGGVAVVVYAPPDLADVLPRYLDASQLALEELGAWYGAYPWPRLTVLVPPPEAGGVGGMEYPTLVTAEAPSGLPLGLDAGVRLPEVVTVHEIAHQWFPMQMQSNEAAEPWLDEGFADYVTTRVLEKRYGVDASLVDTPFAQAGYRALHHTLYVTSATDQVLTRPAWEYDGNAYGATVYSKGSLALRTVQGYLGEERMLAAMRAYADRWRWGHPTTADWVEAVESSSGEDLDWLLQPLLYGTETVEYAVLSVESDPEGAGHVGRVGIRRVGALAVPVDVLLSFADGSQQTIRWDGRDVETELTATAAAPLSSVSLDPGRELALELNPLDNELSTGIAEQVLGGIARWLGAVQWLTRLGGMLG